MKTSKDIMKSYQMPKKLDLDLDHHIMASEFSMNIIFEEITKSFTEQTDEAIINFLYEKYKNTDVSRIYVLSKPDFEKFLLEMLPKYMKGR